MNPLAKFTPEQLLAELERRREADNNPEIKDGKWCHNCQNFKAWTGFREVPAKYNACSLKHVMKFACPKDDWLGDATGFYRLYCEDFVRAKEPTPEPPPQFIPGPIFVLQKP